ncbi:hypothetical protein CDV36_014181 [Fusarium kuroshium]|uniref:Zinc finger C2H2 LYAR-type domain-containing protein n=1 Tax=Fusarium kuroshium TaxID=2010991 RepID=A0A3M2RJ11_9HYPO|nr:hypothetical protein CDV36_014181 [Fusarium kuroshium]
MVSFSCEACGDVLTKKKLDPHRNRCRGATFTCIDCMVHFPGVQYRSHTSCMTEDQKYQGALYKDNKNKNKKQKHSHPNYNPPTTPQQTQVQSLSQAIVNTNDNNNNNNDDEDHEDATMAHHAYVEDLPEDHDYEWAEYEDVDDSSDDEFADGPPPEAPTPPSAAPEPHVDVFEFLVGTGQTPNASNMNLAACHALADAEPSTSLVRYEPKTEEYPYMEEDDDDDDDDDEDEDDDDEPVAKFAQAPPPEPQFVTPAPKTERRKSRSSTEKKDKKRKRLHVEVPNDQVMTDAPPVLHSGLTGGLNRMMRPVFPPSPDYSGGDAPEVSPASPLKKTKHSKKHAGHSLFGMIAGATKPKSKSKSKTKSSKTKSSKTKKTSSSSKKHSHKEKKPQLIEYRPQSKDGKTEPGNNQVILFKPRADVFLSFVDKGPESEKGMSMNKVLKRFHREREATGSELGKGKEEKELWRSLRLRQNERGEIVLFSIE